MTHASVWVSECTNLLASTNLLNPSAQKHPRLGQSPGALRDARQCVGEGAQGRVGGVVTQGGRRVLGRDFFSSFIFFIYNGKKIVYT